MEKQQISEYIEKDRTFLRALNFSENYIKELMEATSRWLGTGLLEGIEDSYKIRLTAILLENQRIANESLNDRNKVWEDWESISKRISVPIVRRVIPHMAANEMVSIQAMRTPQDACYYTDFDGRTVPVKMTAIPKMLQSHYKFNYEQGPSFSLQNEADNCATLASDINNELTRDIIMNISPNAGSSAIYEYKDIEGLKLAIDRMAVLIGSKIYNRSANWLVTSSVIAELLMPDEKVEYEDGVHYVGMYKNIKIFEDTTAPDENILMGHKDKLNPHFSGYIYAPYRLFQIIEKKDDAGLVLTRHAHTLGNPNFYGTIKIENLPTPLEEGDK